MKASSPSPASPPSTAVEYGWRVVATIASVALLVVIAVVVYHFAKTPASSPVAPTTASARVADFGAESPSPDARHLADWIAGSGDNAGGVFIIIDKKATRLYVFDGEARLRGATPVLLGG